MDDSLKSPLIRKLDLGVITYFSFSKYGFAVLEQKPIKALYSESIWVRFIS